MNRRRLIQAAALAALIPVAGSAQATPQASPVPAGTPDPLAPPPWREQFLSRYPPVEDVRDLWTRPWSFDGEQFSFTGEVTQLQVAAPGRGWDLSEEQDGSLWARTRMAIWVPFANGEGDTLLVSYNDDPEGVYEGDTVLVAGEFAGFFTGENVSGVEWTWPVIKAVFVELVPPGEG